MSKPKIKHLAAFRDLGGIETKDGKKIKRKKLFRSGHHGKLTRAEAELMRTFFGVTDIVDLRSPSEISERPDVTSKKIKFRHLPSLNDEENPSINRKNRYSELKRLMSKEGGTRAHLCRVYRMLATNEMAIASHRELFNTIIESRGGVLWHCTQGKDRTGVATALVLSALGVSREVVKKDYMLYNSKAAVKNFFIFLAMSIMFIGSKKASSLNYLLTANEDYIDAFFDQIESNYGTVERYINEALCIDGDRLSLMRRKYLV